MWACTFTEMPIVCSYKDLWGNKIKMTIFTGYVPKNEVEFCGVQNAY